MSIHSDQEPNMLHCTNPDSPARTQATVAMGFVTGILAGLARRQIDPLPLLRATDIDIADTASRIPSSAMPPSTTA
jgi:hypothetical protein